MKTRTGYLIMILFGVFLFIALNKTVSETYALWSTLPAQPTATPANLSVEFLETAEEFQLFLPIFIVPMGVTPPPTPTNTPTPTSTPPAYTPQEISCIYGMNWWRNPNPPHNIIRSDYVPVCLQATDIVVSHFYDQVGRQIAYEAVVERSDLEDFTMRADYTFNSGGGVIGAVVTKTYQSGMGFNMSISRFCPVVGLLSGFETIYDSLLYLHGSC